MLWLISRILDDLILVLSSLVLVLMIPSISTEILIFSQSSRQRNTTISPSIKDYKQHKNEQF
jgi:hypothetical protein